MNGQQHFDGVTTRLEFDGVSLHSTFHDRNDGAFVAELICPDDDDTAAEMPAIAAQVVTAVNSHSALIAACTAALALLQSTASIDADRTVEGLLADALRSANSL